MSSARLHPRFLQLVFLVSLALACVGCWEEIRYDPSKTPLPPQPTLQEVAASVDDVQEDSPTVEDLFAGDSPAPEPEEPEQLAELEQPEETVAQPDAPLTAALESNEGHSPETTSPAPPADLDWLGDTPVTEAGEPATEEVIAEVAEPPEPAAASRTAIAAWRMGSKWSLALAYFAKGLDADRYGELLKEASYAAQLLDLELPALPEKPDGTPLQPAVVRYLLEESGPGLVEKLDEHFPADHAALAELALKTHALLLLYTPSNKDLDPLVSAIRLAAENSGLPESVWRELVELLERRAEFTKVKRAVFQLHDQATAHLAK